MNNREIDILIGEKIMHLPYVSKIFKPSTDIKDAWEVVEFFKGLEKFEDEFNEHICHIRLTEITPRDICLAALKVVGIEVD